MDTRSDVEDESDNTDQEIEDQKVGPYVLKPSREDIHRILIAAAKVNFDIF